MSENNLDRGDSEFFFNLAVQQYASIDLFFYLDRCPYTQIKALCVGVKKGYLVTRVPLEKIEEKQIIWGSEVTGYFTVRDATIEHCHFTSRLVRMYTAPVNSMYLVFPLPKTLDHNRRRFSRRVVPEKEFLQKLNLWHGELQGGDIESLPVLRWINLKNQQCQLGEISANGLRLDLGEKSPALPRLNVNDRILLRGDFGTASKPFNIFVIAVIVRKMADPENEELVNIGCHFINWRKVDDARNTSWLRCDAQEGIGVIAQWVSRNFRNLQT